MKGRHGRFSAMRPIRSVLAAILAVVSGCAGDDQAGADADERPSVPVAADSFPHVPDSAWVSVNGVTMIGFYPIRSNEELERDEGLATALDDFAYHIGTAMDSLVAQDVTVHYRGGDTVWLRTPSLRWRFSRPADSADVGYLFADTARRMAPVYGVRTWIDLVEYAREFRHTGTIRASLGRTPDAPQGG